MATEAKSPPAAPSDAEAQAILDTLGVSPELNLINVLQDVQERVGYIPPNVVKRISRRMKIPLSRVYGAITFYAQFYTEPHGRHTIRCCRGTVCHVKTARWVLDAVRKELGIDVGETTSDSMSSLKTVACLGMCFLAPMMMIDDQYFGQLTPKRVQEILQAYRNRER